MARIELIPLPTTHRVAPGDDLVALILDAAATAGVRLADGDVLCVASKVVSKAEGAYAELPPGEDVHAARRQLAAREAVRVVADTPAVLVVETRHGFVCANAGIDTSNVAGERALLLPDDPDAAAAQLRAGLVERARADLGVVVTDTFGRPWRMGQTDVALGAAGVTAVRDERGSCDLEGRRLEVTMVAVADELAAAADLARRKADGTPFVLVRGAQVRGEGTGRELVRPASQDLFRHAGVTAIEAAVHGPAGPTGGGGLRQRPSPTERAVAAATASVPTGDRGGHVRDLRGGPHAGSGQDAVVLGFFTDGTSAQLLWAGAAAERARLVLEAVGLEPRWIPAPREAPAGESLLAGTLVAREVTPPAAP